ncbi:hypothetical protein [Desulfosporosinus orientis]|nr:hypothetical protein [Desulfosporosinus orientis]
MSELVLPITTANLEQCVELYITVFNSEPWNDKERQNTFIEKTII